MRGALPFRFLDPVDAARNDTLIGAIEQRGFFSDEAAFKEIEDSHVECLPSESRRGFDDFVERFTFGLSVFDGVLHAQTVTHDFERGHASTPDSGQKTLADNPSESLGQTDSNLM